MSNQMVPIDNNVSQALQQFKEVSPQSAQLLYDYVSAIKNQSVVALGTNEAFALRDESGEIKAFKQVLHLSEKDGTIIKPGFGQNIPYVLSAQGYEVWAECVGASCIFPKEVLVGGEWSPNPYVERDPHNRRILAVYARAIAFKYSSKGIPQVSDWTTIFDTPSYRLIDLLGKAKKNPQAFKLLPSEMKKPEADGTWAKYPFDESSNLWVNTAHEEALTWYSQILNREKKSMDFAQTFAKRNALKHLSGIQKAPGTQWALEVISWRPVNGNIVKWDATQYSQLQNRVAAMIEGDTNEFKADSIEIKVGQERVSDEEGATVIEAATDPEDQAEVIEAQKIESKKTTELTESHKKALQQLDVIQSDFSDEYKQACNLLSVDLAAIPDEETAQRIYSEVNRIIDEA